LIVHIADIADLTKIVEGVDEVSQKLMDAFWPGALTIVFKSKDCVSKLVTCGKPTVAIRMPSHPVAIALIGASGVPIAAPSANTSGRPSPTLAEHVKEDLDGKIAGIVDGGATHDGLESTVIDCVHMPPTILRPGSVTQAQIEAVVGPVRLVTTHDSEDDAPRAPGMKYTHYAPKAPVKVVHGSTAFVKECIDKAQKEDCKVGILASTELLEELKQQGCVADVARQCGSRLELQSVSHAMYDGLRSFDLTSVDVIFAEGFEDDGLGSAIMNRLNKAAGNVALVENSD